MKPAPGMYRIDGLSPGEHRLRIEVASESQAGPTVFGGFFAAKGTRAVPLPVRRRQIEFIGDSHTVGYANTSNKQDCTQDEVWRSTDTSHAFGPMLARHYDADYQVNANSGRSVVRNYNGFAADPLPAAYSHVLFDEHATLAAQAPSARTWSPQVVVIALGTNDFTTPLHAGEKWATRDQLHAGFEATYVAFVRQLRAQKPRAFFVLWATDKADGEVEAEAAEVVQRLRGAGETRVAYVPIKGLSFAACHSHPSIADERTIMDKLRTAIDAQLQAW